MSGSSYWDRITKEEADKAIDFYRMFLPDEEDEPMGPVEAEIITDCVVIEENCEILRKPPKEITWTP